MGLDLEAGRAALFPLPNLQILSAWVANSVLGGFGSGGGGALRFAPFPTCKFLSACVANSVLGGSGSGGGGCLWLSAPVFAQTTTATLQGMIADATGGALPRPSVRVEGPRVDRTATAINEVEVSLT